MLDIACARPTWPISKSPQFLANIQKRSTSDPGNWNIPVLVNTETFLVYQYCLKCAIYILYNMLLQCYPKPHKTGVKNGLVSSNTCVIVSGTWSTLVHNIQQWWYFIFSHILDEDMLLKTKQCTQQLFLTQHSITHMPTYPPPGRQQFHNRILFPRNAQSLRKCLSLALSLQCMHGQRRTICKRIVDVQCCNMLYLNVVPRLIFISLKKIYLWWCLGFQVFSFFSHVTKA